MDGFDTAQAEPSEKTAFCLHTNVPDWVCKRGNYSLHCSFSCQFETNNLFLHLILSASHPTGYDCHSVALDKEKVFLSDANFTGKFKLHLNLCMSVSFHFSHELW